VGFVVGVLMVIGTVYLGVLKVHKGLSVLEEVLEEAGKGDDNFGIKMRNIAGIEKKYNYKCGLLHFVVTSLLAIALLYGGYGVLFILIWYLLYSVALKYITDFISDVIIWAS